MAAPVAVFLQGGQSIDYTPGSGVDAGDVVVLGVRCGVAKHAIAANTLGALCIDGVFTMPKAVLSTSALAVGVAAYWDTGTETIGEDTGDTLFGHVVEAASASATTVKVKLHW